MQRVQRRGFVIAIGDDDHDRGARDPAQQKLEHIHRCGLRPVEILEHEQQRPLRGEIGETAKERLEEANAFALGVEARHCGKSDAGMDLRKQRCDARQRHARSERSDEREAAAKPVDDAFVRNRFGRTGSPDEHASAAIFDGVRELPDESRFTDPGFAADEDASAVPVNDPAPSLEQTLHLVVPPYERKNRTGPCDHRPFRFAVPLAGGLPERNTLGQRHRFGHRLGPHLGA